MNRVLTRLFGLKSHKCHVPECRAGVKSVSQRWIQSGGEQFDVVVVGGGHAGTEAACAAARMGANTLLITHKFDTIGEMSCNPSFGGIGKGHLMKEVDALDGVCARVCDETGIYYRVLNKKRGPAVWGHRAQIDRSMYKEKIQQEVSNTKNLQVLAAPVEDFILKECTNPDQDLMKQTCCGVILGNGDKVYAGSVVLTAGTFLRGSIQIGLDKYPAGRMGDEPAVGLAKSLEDAGFTIGRLKTGTPPRLDGRKIDFSKTKPWLPDNPPEPFSFLNEEVRIKPEDQILTYLTSTNEETEKIVMETLHLNRHVQEEVNGPRFCPSIEAKFLQFKGRVNHQVWLEPEGLHSYVVYPQGLSCTMPEEHQLRLVRTLPGLEKVDITKPGYGVEYDFMDPRQLKLSLETIRIQNLFFAGQINGTTGYEEAAAQGIIAGINAAAKVQRKPALTIDRTEGYIGVLIDDLTTHGTNEPYRMFTSRSEFRLSLRPDNADRRLTHKGFDVGCVSQKRYDATRNLYNDLDTVVNHLKTIKKTHSQWNKLLGFPDTDNPTSFNALDVLSLPGVTVEMILPILPQSCSSLIHNEKIKQKIQNEGMYSRELAKEMKIANEVRQDEQLHLPDNIDYFSLHGISKDCKEKLVSARPTTIAAASRIPGMTPVAIYRLLLYVKNHKKQAQLLL